MPRASNSAFASATSCCILPMDGMSFPAMIAIWAASSKIARAKSCCLI
jgi:hypothetical protein